MFIILMSKKKKKIIISWVMIETYSFFKVLESTEIQTHRNSVV